MEKDKKRGEFVDKSLAAAISHVGIATAGLGIAICTSFSTSSSRADTINYVETNVASGTAGIQIGNTPANGGTDPAAYITFIGSYAGTTSDGYTYTNWQLLVNDGTGSMDLFGHMPTSSTYTPTAGDQITATGTYSPFDGDPELETLTAISKLGSGGTAPAPITVTIPQMVALAADPMTGAASATYYQSVEYLMVLDDVTLAQTSPTAGGSTFAVHANTTLIATDTSSNTVTVFQYASSYSVAGLLGGTTIPTYPVDITGIMDVFSGAPEFIPFSISPVPEPATLGLVGMGALVLLARRPRRT
jgi:hypothetical protein